MKFPFYRQLDKKDCGPICLKIISKFYGKDTILEIILREAETTRGGTTLKGMVDAAERLGFKSLPVKISFDKLQNEAILPCILYWDQKHYVVLYKITKNKIFIADPSFGLLTYKKKEFLDHWIGKRDVSCESEGVALLLEPSADFAEDEISDRNAKSGVALLFGYLSPYKKLILQIFAALLIGGVLQSIVPFLTQAIVDIGIRNGNINFIYIVLIAQLFVFIGRIGFEIIRTWIVNYISSRINVSIISDVLVKLMKLPISFFDTKITGDLIQRIRDHERVEVFLTQTSLDIIYSVFSIFIFSIVLAIYNLKIFLCFIIGSLVAAIWVFLFYKKRMETEYKSISIVSQEQSKIIELINGMQEIKINNAERKKRWEWEHIQAKLFKIKLKGLKIFQVQSAGSKIILELNNIFIIILAAQYTINGELTVGMLLSISYLTGQINIPISQIPFFLYTFQNAKISLERLAEIQTKENEESPGLVQEHFPSSNINLNGVSFRYSGALNPVIDKLSITIPSGKTTAIVGSSGSGKTTLLKILLKFYEIENGEIMIGNRNLKHISFKEWRNKCGVVMQNGFLFTDTIAKNIVPGEEEIENTRLIEAVRIANIQKFIEELPLGYDTLIGNEGMNLSAGQKQRILIARAIYKNPEYLFLDEATSALDTSNEKIISKNLQEFLKDRTAIIIAHRLSTVINADNIIVLENGRVVESGCHKTLVNKEGLYFNLIKDQLVLNN